MKLSERAKYYYLDENMNCAVSVLLAASDHYDLGLTKADAKMMVGFGGGLGCGHLCGALSGAVAAMGKLLLPDGVMRSHDFAEVCAEFVASFEKEWATSMCGELKEKIFDPDVRCAKAVLKTADMLQEYLDKILAENRVFSA